MSKINEKYESLVQCTKLSKKSQKKLINWFNKQNILIQIDVFYEQKNQFFKIRDIGFDDKIVPLAAFLLAINSLYLREIEQKSKNKETDLGKSRKTTEFSIKKVQKVRYKEKHEKLLNLWTIVINLRAESFSFRQISAYLKSRHRFVVSHTYIRNLWKELENAN